MVAHALLAVNFEVSISSREEILLELILLHLALLAFLSVPLGSTQTAASEAFQILN